MAPLVKRKCVRGQKRCKAAGKVESDQCRTQPVGSDGQWRLSCTKSRRTRWVGAHEQRLSHSRGTIESPWEEEEGGEAEVVLHCSIGNAALRHKTIYGRNKRWPCFLQLSRVSPPQRMKTNYLVPEHEK